MIANDDETSTDTPPVEAQSTPTSLPETDLIQGDETIARAIEGAEEVRDPLHGLIERTEANPGAPFEPEVLEALVALRSEDRAAFENLRKELKKAGCRVTELDKVISAQDPDPGGRAPSQADVLLELAQEAELFHAPDGTGYADVQVNSHRETWPVRSKGFRRWLSQQYLEETNGAPSSEAMQSALNAIDAKTHYRGPERVVHIRVGGVDDRLYLDLGDEAWRALEIDPTGWRVIDNPPVRFRRASGMQPLPEPVPGGSIEALRSFLNVKSDTDFVLVVAWALAVLRNHGPYPMLALSGEQGSAKSTFSAILRALLDPNTAPLRALPREDRDLFIAANNGHVLAFDNVSGLPAWLSDTLCRLATGGGFAVRQHYTDQDEVLFEATRPVILNGIEDIVTRPDLADRAVFLTLEAISEEHRLPEANIWTAFYAERPRILGVLLDAVVEGLRRLPETILPKLPRMADFAMWVTACETALWPAGTFWAAYSGNLDEAVEGVIDADPVADAVRALLAVHMDWKGTATELLSALAGTVDERVVKSRGWPNNARALSGRLRRAATFLRKIGIEISGGSSRVGGTLPPLFAHSARAGAGENPAPLQPAATPGSKPEPQPRSRCQMNDERVDTREVMLRALGRGRFAAIANDGRVLAESHTPIFDAARVLQSEGVAGGTVLEARHEGSPIVSMRVTVAVAAALTVEEGPSGPRFRAYRPREAVENDRTADFTGPMVRHTAPVGSSVCEEYP